MKQDRQPQTTQPEPSSYPLAVVTKRTSFTYLNWRKEVARRTVRPICIWFGATEWHPEQQWFMRAVDLEKDQIRDFAMKDMSDVSTEG